MGNAVTLTDHQKRQFRDYLNALSNRPPGADLVTILENLGNIAIATGQATVLNAATTAVVTVGEAFNGGFVLAQFAEAPTAADLDVWGSVAGGDLTLTTSADNTADILVNYLIIVDGRTTP